MARLTKPPERQFRRLTRRPFRHIRLRAALGRPPEPARPRVCGRVAIGGAEPVPAKVARILQCGHPKVVIVSANT